MKRMTAVCILVLVVLSTLAAAEEDCGFFCKVENWLRGEGNLVGEAAVEPPQYRDVNSLNNVERQTRERVLTEFIKSNPSKSRLTPNVYKTRDKERLLSDLEIAGLIPKSYQYVSRTGVAEDFQIINQGNNWVFKSDNQLLIGDRVGTLLRELKPADPSPARSIKASAVPSTSTYTSTATTASPSVVKSAVVSEENNNVFLVSGINNHAQFRYNNDKGQWEFKESQSWVNVEEMMDFGGAFKYRMLANALINYDKSTGTAYLQELTQGNIGPGYNIESISAEIFDSKNDITIPNNLQDVQLEKYSPQNNPELYEVNNRLFIIADIEGPQVFELNDDNTVTKSSTYSANQFKSELRFTKIGTYVKGGTNQWVEEATAGSKAIEKIKNINLYFSFEQSSSPVSTPTRIPIPAGSEIQTALARVPTLEINSELKIITPDQKTDYGPIISALDYLGYKYDNDDLRIKDYQEVSGLQVDGIIGSQTIAAINKDLQKVKNRIIDGITPPVGNLIFGDIQVINEVPYSVELGEREFLLKDMSGNFFSSRTGKLVSAPKIINSPLVLEPSVTVTRIKLDIKTTARLDQQLTEKEVELQEKQKQFNDLIDKNDLKNAKKASKRIESLRTEINKLESQLASRSPDYDSLSLINRDLRDFQRGKGDTSHNRAAKRAKTLAGKIHNKYTDEQWKLLDKYKSDADELETLLDKKKRSQEEIGRVISLSKSISEFPMGNAMEIDEQQEENLLQAAEGFEQRGFWLEEAVGEYYQSLIKGDNQYSRSAGYFLQGIGRLGSYRALSNLLFSSEVANNYLFETNSHLFTDWTNLPSFVATVGLKNAISWCNKDDLKRSNQPGQNYLIVETPSGIRHPAAVIFGEKSESKVHLACTADKDGKLGCKKNPEDTLVCKPDKFCYLNRDAVEPLQAKFYKVTWGLSVPGDVSFTPYVDEAGKAVKFNIELRTVDGAKKYLYARGSAPELQVLELENGAKDGSTLAFYSQNDYTQVCIAFHPSYRMKDFSDGEYITEFCGQIGSAETSEIEFLDSSRETPSVTTQSAEVAVNSDI